MSKGVWSIFGVVAAAGCVVGMAGISGPRAADAGPAVTEDDPRDVIVLTGVVRDFHTHHPDMEKFPGSGTKNLVRPMLGGDGKPVFNRDLIDVQGRTFGSDIQVSSEESFDQWFRDVPGINVSFPHTIELVRQEDGKYVFAKERPEYFWPADGLGFGNSTGPLRWARPGSHNYHFTYEVECDFTYTDPAERENELVFRFVGDDDVWVYVNDHLVIDLGGVHSQQEASVNIDSIASTIGLTPGGTYRLKLFFAERHTSESNFRIETTLQLRRVELPPVSGLHD
jgi:fibro-slime domain-containing protein